jgi:glycosyltransferase involved in cell wall biosynthesis
MESIGCLNHVSGIDDRRFDRVRIIRQNHAGCFPALNRGIAEMKTEWFAWLSDDDLFYPTKIARQLKAMRAIGGACASYHSYDVLIADGHVAETVFCPIGWKTIEDQQATLSKGCAINGLTVMIHRSVFDDLGVFDTSFHICADWEMWNRIGVKHLWRGINDVLATRRQYRNEIMNASGRYAADPKMRKLWIAEDDRIKAMYRVEEKAP